MAKEDCLKRWLNRTLEVQEPELQFPKHLHWGSLLIKGSSRSDLITDLDFLCCSPWCPVKMEHELTSRFERKPLKQCGFSQRNHSRQQRWRCHFWLTANQFSEIHKVGFNWQFTIWQDGWKLNHKTVNWQIFVTVFCALNVVYLFINLTCQLTQH